MAFVYWIHLPQHTDITKEGYVGITTMEDPKLRFSKHQSDARDPNKCFVVHHAINKYGDDIIYEVIAECSFEEACVMEFDLRPTKYIGWNINKGGDKPWLGETWSEEQRIKYKTTRASSPPPIRQAVSTQRQKETIDNKHPLDLHRINLEYWSHCLIIYSLYLEGDSPYIATKKLGLSRSGVYAMWKRFERGWIPTEDLRMLEFVEKHPPYLSVKETNEDTKTNIVGVSIHKGSYVGYKNVEGKRVSKYFGIKKYGEELALQLATDFRENG